MATLLVLLSLVTACGSDEPSIGGTSVEQSEQVATCARAQPFVPELATGLDKLGLGARADQQAIDELADTLMAVHAALDGTDWDDLAERARHAITEVANLPMGTGAQARLDRTMWVLTPASIHDRIIERCNEPSSDEAQKRREQFLDETSKP